jgi:proteic killer suppression protein
VIISFKHKGVRLYFERGDSSKIKAAQRKRLRLILTLLNAAAEIKDLNFPGANLHKLKGDLKDFWSISTSGNWRIIFRFIDGDVYDIDYLDYH